MPECSFPFLHELHASNTGSAGRPAIGDAPEQAGRIWADARRAIWVWFGSPAGLSAPIMPGRTSPIIHAEAVRRSADHRRKFCRPPRDLAPNGAYPGRPAGTGAIFRHIPLTKPTAQAPSLFGCEVKLMAALKRSGARENATRGKACNSQVEIQQNGTRWPSSSIAVARPRRAAAKRRGR
jgi:hypothetical protein